MYTDLAEHNVPPPPLPVHPMYLVLDNIHVRYKKHAIIWSSLKVSLFAIRD